VISYQDLLRIEGDLELLRSMEMTIEKILEGAFWSADFEPLGYKSFRVKPQPRDRLEVSRRST
jgi:hypothetical protein